MELADASLEDALKAISGRGSLSLELMRHMARQVFKALLVCHNAGIAHNDVTAKNFLLMPGSLGTFLDVQSGHAVGKLGNAQIVHSIKLKISDFGRATDASSDFKVDAIQAGLLLERLVNSTDYPGHASREAADDLTSKLRLGSLSLNAALEHRFTSLSS